MLGRLIDQMLPTHVHCPDEARTAQHFVRSHPHLRSYASTSPWGSTLPLLQSTDLLLGNLETAVTTHETKWPDKVFNYRMHPDNLSVLREAKMDYVSVANNHSLDFGRKGLRETLRSLRSARISCAGAGDDGKDANRPAELRLPRGGKPAADYGVEEEEEEEEEEGEEQAPPSHEIQVYAFSDHPHDWSAVPEFNLIDYTPATFSRLQSQLTTTTTSPSDPSAIPARPSAAPSLKIVSIHWGPNYSWTPSPSIRSLAHHLLDNCAVDIIHGHSAHHVQGVELHRGKPIIYGCGDFVDDYAVNKEYRNDLSAVWRVEVQETETETGGATEGRKGKGKRLKPVRLCVYPTRITKFQAELLDSQDADWDFVAERVTTLSEEFGTVVRRVEGAAGGRADEGARLVVDFVA